MVRLVTVSSLIILLHPSLFTQWVSAPRPGLPPFGSGPRVIAPAGPAPQTPGEKGDLMKQVRMFERWFGAAGQPDAATRADIHEALEAEGEMPPAKHRTISAPPTKWQFRGPLGMETSCDPGKYWAGRINALAWHPVKGMYFGSAHGGLFGPIPFGVVPITDYLPSLVCGDIAIDPVNPSVIYYGTGDFMTGGRGTAGAGVYRSPDGGYLWDKLPLFPTPTKVSKILIAPWDHNIVLIATEVGLFRFPDTNGVWGKVGKWGAWSDIAAASDGSVLLGARPGIGVSRSTDGGLHWTEISGLEKSLIDNIKVAIAPGDPNRAYIAMARPFSTGSTTMTGQIRVIYTTSNLLAPVPAWTTITPTGDNAMYLFSQGWYHNEIEVDPTSPGTVYAAGGTILKSTNFGGSWTNLSNVPHYDIRRIFFRPGDNLLYAAGDGGVFTTSDGGTTWDTQINRYLPTALFYNLSVARSDDDVVFAAAQDNATDGTSPGNRSTWKVFNGADGIDVRVDWSDENIVFTSTQVGAVHRSTHGGPESGCIWPIVNDSATVGMEWETTIWQEPQFQDWFYFNGSDYIYYSSNKGGDWGVVSTTSTADGADLLYVETNTDGSELYAAAASPYWPVVRYHYIGGNAWTYSTVSSGLPAQEPVRIVTSQSHPARAFVIFNGPTQAKRIWRTTNRGGSWTDITGDLKYGIKLFDILEDPYNSSVLYIGTDHGAFKSTNTGATWGWWTAGMPGATWVTDLEYVYSPGGDYVAAATFGRGVYERDADAPATYPIYASGPLSAIKGSGEFVLVAGPAGKVGKSVDAGAGWTDVSVAGGADLNDIHLIDTSKYLVVGNGGEIFFTTNGGTSWTPPSSPTGYDLRKLAFVSEMIGFAAGDSGALLKTTDAGQSWADVSPGFNFSFFDIFFTDEMHGFLAGHVPEGVINERRFLKTTDGGQTWDADPSLSAVGSFFDIFFADPSNGFMTTDNGSLMKTTDGGGSWTEMPTGFGTALLGCHFTTPMKGWVCGVEGLLLSTSDGGATWVQEETGTVADLAAIGFVAGELAVAGSTGLLARPLLQPTGATFTFAQGWNLVSVPFGLAEYHADAVFPGVASSLYSFDGGYEAQSILGNGRGYWAKFNVPATIPVTGYPTLDVTIDVKQGWNLVGSIASPLGVSEVAQLPEGIVTSQFFGYDGGYSAAGILEPGSGYWVKVSEDGQLRLKAGPVRVGDSVLTGPGSILDQTRAMLDDFSRIEVADSRGRRASLHFTISGGKESLIKFFDAPPAPPVPGFDVRFSTGRLVESVMEGASRSAGISISGADYPVTIRWEEREGHPTGYLRLPETLTPLAGTGMVTLAGPSEQAVLILPGGSDGGIPTAYALEDAFPNPFNPSTTIRYALPEPSNVSIVIYDLLGRRVAMLADGHEEAGRRSVRWDAAEFSGGVYFCRFEAGQFSATKKLVLLR